MLRAMSEFALMSKTPPAVARPWGKRAAFCGF
jgi:hypothetical protein